MRGSQRPGGGCAEAAGYPGDDHRERDLHVGEGGIPSARGRRWYQPELAFFRLESPCFHWIHLLASASLWMQRAAFLFGLADRLCALATLAWQRSVRAPRRGSDHVTHPLDPTIMARNPLECIELLWNDSGAFLPPHSQSEPSLQRRGAS